MRINSSELIQGIIRDSRISSSEGVITDLGKQVIPVMEVNPRLTRYAIARNVTSSVTTASLTILTTDTATDFYLTSCVLSLIKDATCDVAIGNCSISTTIQGITRILVAIPMLTSTAQSNNISISFPFPVKIDRGVLIVLLMASYSAGLSSRIAMITGFYDESSKA